MSDYRIGIELTENHLHFCLVSKKNNCWRLLESQSHLLSAANELPSILRIIRKTIPRFNRQIILGLAYHHVLMKEIKIDSSLADKEIYFYLQNQAHVLFGKTERHWVLDYEFCQSMSNEISYRQIRVIAAAKAEIFRVNKLFYSSHLKIRFIQVDVLALSRLMSFFEFFKPEIPQGLLWIKTSELIFIVAKAENLLYVKRTSYQHDKSLQEILTSLLQFFYALFPQTNLETIFLLNTIKDIMFNTDIIDLNSIYLKNAIINCEFFTKIETILPSAFCSLGLATYEY